MARKYGKKKMWQTVGAVAIAAIVCVGAVAGIGAIVNQGEDDGFEKVHVRYEIGGLDDNGKYVETDESLYTKEAFDVENRETVYGDIDFDSNITWQAYFYGEDDTYIESTAVLTGDFKATVPEGALTCRIKITPIWDKDVEEDDQKVTAFNKGSFENQLKLHVSEEVEEPEENSSSEA